MEQVYTNKEVFEAVARLLKEGKDALHSISLPFGKHAGKSLPSVPLSYLKWLHNQDSEWNGVIEAEFDRRGAILTKDVELTGHAIDRASLRLMPSFNRRSDKSEGLYSWLSGVFNDALYKHPEFEGKEKFTYNKIRFIVKWGVDYPVVTSVYWDQKRRSG